MPNKYYRKNVSMITFRGDQFLLINSVKHSKTFWKFPQGGINYKETLEQAAIREFKEELGTDKIRIMDRSKIKRAYLWDRAITIKNKTYIGQVQRFLLIQFLGNDHDIKLQAQELRAYCWCNVEDLEKILTTKDMGYEDYWPTIQKVLERYRDKSTN